MGSEVEQHIPNQTTNTNINKSNENKNTNTNTNGNISVAKTLSIVQPHSLLPKPTPPIATSNPKPPNDAAPSTFKTFFRQRSNNLSSAISRTISSIKTSIDDINDKNNSSFNDVTEFKLSGLKVVVETKNDLSLGKVQITLFSKSNCRDCSAVRRFFKERGMKFVEINVDVYTKRENELYQRTGNTNVPKIFFNGELIGGLVELNAMRKNEGGELEKKLNEVADEKFSGDVPVAPEYGFDEVAEEVVEEEVEIVKVVRALRQRLPIQDRLVKMKIVRNCFAGTELVEFLIRHHGYVHAEAVEIGSLLCQKYFINSVFGEIDFEEGNHFYRFLEHEGFIPKCFNFRGTTNDSEPKNAATVCDRLTKIMYAILESYASEDRRRVDYVAISKSEEFRRYVNMTQDLQRVDLLELSENEKLAFFLNMYNAMVIHAMIRVGCQEGAINRRSFSDFQYLIGGHPYSLAIITNGILRSNRRSPYSLVKPFGTRDRRLEVGKNGRTSSQNSVFRYQDWSQSVAVVKMNPLIHFGLCNGTKSSPKVRFFSPCRVAEELRCAAREFLENDGIEVDLEKRTLHLSPIFKWYSADFGHERNVVKWIMNYLDANKTGLLTHLLDDGGPVHISYKNYDWSINS